MNPHYHKKKGRDSYQEREYSERHLAIVKILLTTSPKNPISRGHLMDLSGIKSKRILRKHLDDIKKKDLLGEEKRMLFWAPNQRLAKVWEDMIDNLTEQLAIHNIDSDDYFSEAIIATFPKKTGKGLVYDMRVIPREIWMDFLDFENVNRLSEKKLEEIAEKVKLEQKKKE